MAKALGGGLNVSSRGVMDALVAIRVEIKDGSTRDCLTFGQVGLSASELEEAALRFVNSVVEPGQGSSAEVCASLQAVREKPYFFEALAEATAEQATYGWNMVGRALLRRRLRSGRGIWFLGA